MSSKTILKQYLDNQILEITKLTLHQITIFEKWPNIIVNIIIENILVLQYM